MDHARHNFLRRRNFFGILLLGASAALTVVCQAQTTSWQATSGGLPTGGNWFTGTNWSNGVPDYGSVRIGDTRGNPVIIESGSATAGSFRLATSGTAELVIGTGGQLTGDVFNVGSYSSDLAKATLTIAGGRLDAKFQLNVGSTNTDAQMNLSNGAVANTLDLAVRSDSAAAPATLRLSTSSTMSATLFILYADGGGSAVFEADGGSILSSESIRFSGSNGTATATLSGSARMTASETFFLADSGSATLNISDHAVVEIGTDALVRVGNSVGSAGTLSVSDHGVWKSDTVYLGYNGTATVNIASSGTMIARDSYIGFGESGSATVSVTDSGQWNADSLRIDRGTLNILNGGVVNSTNCLMGNGGRASATVSGEGSQWNLSGRLSVGISGSASLTVGSGGIVNSSTTMIGRKASVTVSGSGAQLNAGVLSIGESDDGPMGLVTVQNAGAINSTSAVIGSSGPGSLTVSGTGSVWTNTGTIKVGGLYSGTLAVQNGGMVAAAKITKNINQAGIVIDGGTLKALANEVDFLGGSGTSSVQIGAGGVVFDSNGFSIGASSAMVGAGSLLLKGGGSLTLSGSNAYGNTTISNGTLLVGSGTKGTLGTGSVLNNSLLIFNRTDAVTVGNVISGSGAVQQAASGTLTLSGSNSYTGGTVVGSGAKLNFSTDANLGAASGTLTLNGGTLHNTGPIFDLQRRIVLGAGGGTIELGSGGLTLLNAVSGSGALTKTNGNILTLTGAQTYTGSTSVLGGTLKVEAGTLASPTVDVASGARLLFTNSGSYGGRITGSGTFARSDAGTTIFTGTATHVGGTIIESGTLQVGNGGTAGVITGAITNNGVLAYNRSDFHYVGSSISGSGGLAMIGSGALILTGSNSYSGTTTISSGVLAVDLGGTTGSLGTGSVVNNSHLIFGRSDAVTVANVISGSGSVAMLGFGSLTLTGTNSYTGGTTVFSGTLNFASDGNLGALGGRVTLDGGTLHNTAANFSSALRIDLGEAGGTIALGSGGLTLTNAISGSGALTKTNGNILTLTGAQTYTGSTSVQGGTLKVDAGSLASPTVDVASGARLLFDNGGNYAGAITGSGAFARSGSGVTVYTGTASHTGGTVVESGTLQLGNGLANGALSGTVAIANGATFAVNRTGAPTTLANVFTGSGAFLKSGTGTVVLSGSNSFTGGATINAGTLGLGNKDALGSGLLTINGGGIRADGGERTLTNTLALNGSFTLGRLTHFSGSATLGADISITSANPDVSAATTSIMSGVISGNHSITFTTGANPIGTIVLSGSNSYTGGTTIQSGTLRATNTFAMGSGTVTIDGGIFVVDASTAISNDVVLSGGGYRRVVTGNLAHAADASSDFGRATTAAILGGSSGTSIILTTSFSGTSLAINDEYRTSNVYSLQGTGTNTFVLQLSVDEVAATSRLGWLDEDTGLWVNAVTGNTGGTMFFAGDGAYDPLTDFRLGTYGVDTVNGTVWAVLDHNSEFAVIPEPGTCLLVLFGGLGLLTRRRRR